MTISSRTPEGLPASCPLCGASVVVEPSILIGDATCPRCGHLLWFIQTADVTRVFDTERSIATRERFIDIVAEQLGVDRGKIANNPRLVNDADVDSLDMVEMIMEVEEESGL